MKNRIKELRTSLGISQQRLADLAKTSSQQIGNLERGDRKLSHEWMERVSSALGVSPSDLLPDSTTTPLPSNVVAIGRKPNMDAVTTVPEIDVRAGMGGGGEAGVDYWYDDNGNGYQRDAVKEQWQFPTEHIRVKLGTPPEKAVIIEVEGDSMSPTLLTGDHVMINTGDTRPSPPGIFAINDGLGLVVKRLEFIPHSDPLTCRVSSDNKLHTDYERSAEELQVIGRVVWFGRRV
ncbi:helix-turn-helix domain-containing protein [Kiloniella litopenaei]|uniref:helix-turn-helix domain-containing protein n=1 Tax=Kiloniella litopenaei TaxID=1549748 RepID=UPI003BA96BC4